MRNEISQNKYAKMSSENVETKAHKGDECPKLCNVLQHCLEMSRKKTRPADVLKNIFDGNFTKEMCALKVRYVSYKYYLLILFPTAIREFKCCIFSCELNKKIDIELILMLTK